MHGAPHPAQPVCILIPQCRRLADTNDLGGARWGEEATAGGRAALSPPPPPPPRGLPRARGLRSQQRVRPALQPAGAALSTQQHCRRAGALGPAGHRLSWDFPVSVSASRHSTRLTAATHMPRNVPVLRPQTGPCPPLTGRVDGKENKVSQPRNDRRRVSQRVTGRPLSDRKSQPYTQQGREHSESENPKAGPSLAAQALGGGG